MPFDVNTASTHSTKKSWSITVWSKFASSAGHFSCILLGKPRSKPYSTAFLTGQRHGPSLPNCGYSFWPKIVIKSLIYGALRKANNRAKFPHSVCAGTPLELCVYGTIRGSRRSPTRPRMARGVGEPAPDRPTRIGLRVVESNCQRASRSWPDALSWSGKTFVSAFPCST